MVCLPLAFEAVGREFEGDGHDLDWVVVSVALTSTVTSWMGFIRVEEFLHQHC